MLTYLPRESRETRETTTLLEKMRKVLEGIYTAQVDFLYLAANARVGAESSLSIVQMYGVQALAEERDAAVQTARRGLSAVRATMANFEQSRLEPVSLSLRYIRLRALTFTPSNRPSRLPWVLELWADTTLLTMLQAATYVAPGAFEQGAALTVQEMVPPFAFYPNMPGEVVLGHQYSVEVSLAEPTDEPVRLTRERMGNWAVCADTRMGKSVLMEWLSLEVVNQWQFRVIVADFGAGWRKSVSVLPRERVDLWGLSPAAPRPVRWNPLQIGRRIAPEVQLAATVELLCNAGRMGERQMGFMFETLEKLYLDYGVLTHDPAVWEHEKWGRVLDGEREVLARAGIQLPERTVHLSDLDDEVLQALAVHRSKAVAVVVLPQGMVGLTGRLAALDRVREVLVKPVNAAHLIDRCYQVGVSERAARAAMAPATAYATSALAQVSGAARAAAVAGTCIFAVGGGKGGPGKTTVAVGLAYRLNQVGIRTLLMGFDTPDAVGVQLGLPMSPNSLNWYRRPTREGFAASLQNKDGLDVCLSPNDKVEAARIAVRRPNEDGSIVGLIEAARAHHPPYAAIVMDLPPTESEWSIQPLLRANTVLLVCEPDWASQVNLIASVRLLTGMLDPRYQMPREAIHAVLNRVTGEDTLTPARMQTAIRDRLDGWAPPFVAVIPADPGVRACQNDFVPPVTRRQAFAEGIDQIVDFFYREALGVTARKAVGKGRSLFGGIKIKVT